MLPRAHSLQAVGLFYFQLTLSDTAAWRKAMEEPGKPIK